MTLTKSDQKNSSLDHPPSIISTSSNSSSRLVPVKPAVKMNQTVEGGTLTKANTPINKKTQTKTPEAKPTNPLAIPRRPKMEDFEIVKVVGTGSFGIIKLAKYKPTGCPCALKQLDKQKLWKRKQVTHVKHERDVLFQINHPRIVSLYGTMQDDESIYLVMEYVPGGELFTHLRQLNSFDIDTARHYIAQLCTAVAKLHAEGIAYRDIKPENILLDSDGNLKMTDFGFAKVITDISFTLCGTPEYLAPELVQGVGHDRGVDWWAVGILLYEMLEGFPPFFGDQQQIFQQIVQFAPSFVSITDPDAIDLIKKLLRKAKTRRLGCLAGGSKDVLDHPFFSSVNWANIENGHEKGPIVPTLKDPFDSVNFPDPEDDEGEEEPEEEEEDEGDDPFDPKAFEDF